MQYQLNSAGCMNKGFILDGYPRSKEEAQGVFIDRIPIPNEVEVQEGEEEPEPQYDEKVIEKILPQYAIAMEADDAHLMQKMKEMPVEKIDGTHWNDAGMQRRMKDYRAKNVEDSGETVKDFFNQLIGYQNVLVVDGTTKPED